MSGAKFADRRMGIVSRGAAPILSYALSEIDNRSSSALSPSIFLLPSSPTAKLYAKIWMLVVAARIPRGEKSEIASKELAELVCWRRIRRRLSVPFTSEVRAH